MSTSPLNQTVSGDGNIFTGTGDINIFYNHLPPTDEVGRDLMILLNRVKQFWVHGVLAHAIHREALLEIEKDQMNEMVANPWESILELPNQPRTVLPRNKKMIDVFLEAGGSLLILGEPGSGKTITLLQLVRDLIAELDQDSHQPIPVVFNLSTWNEKHASFSVWLTNELRTKYQIPKDLGLLWLKERRLLLMLDGLDEVASNSRAACVKAINDFIQDFGIPGTAVCCRANEYTALPKKLNFTGAIFLKALTLDQVDHYLSELGGKLAALRAALHRDSVLQNLAQSPLMLSILCLTFQGASMPSFDEGANSKPEVAHKKVLDAYVERMFERKGKGELVYSKKQSIFWLGWLAEKMTQHSSSIFLIENLQPDWLRSSRLRFIHSFSSRCVAGLALGLGMGVAGGLYAMGFEAALFMFAVGQVSGLISGVWDSALEKKSLNKTIGLYLLTWAAIIWGLIIILTFSDPSPKLSEIMSVIVASIVAIGVMAIFQWFVYSSPHTHSPTNEIRTIEALQWSLSTPAKWSIVGGFFLCFVVSSLSFLRGLSPLLATLWVLLILIVGLKGGVIEGKTHPNQGIRLTMRNAVLVALLAGVSMGLTAGVIQIFVELSNSIELPTSIVGPVLYLLVITIAVLLITSLPIAIRYGGLEVIKHYCIRFLLWRANYTPRKYQTFLDYAVTLVFLQKVGGGYIFIHRLVLEYFAETYRDISISS